jgi:hypothetical protein
MVVLLEGFAAKRTDLADQLAALRCRHEWSMAAYYSRGS